MIMKMTSEKIIIPLIGLISGILFFLGSFSMSVESTIFNNNYHSNSLKELGVTSLIIDEIHESIDASGFNGIIHSYIEEQVTEDLIVINIGSLVGGLLDYIKGVTDTLPYLYFNQLNKFSDSLNTIADSAQYEIAASPILSLSKMDKVNLRLLVMFSDEEIFDDVLKTAGLLQYLDKNLTIVSAILLSIITMIIISHKKTTMIIEWFRFTSFFYSILCLTTIYIITILKIYGHYRLESIVNSTNADFIEFAKIYVTSMAGSLVKQLLLSFLLVVICLYIILKQTGLYYKPLSEVPTLRIKPVSWVAGIMPAVLSVALCLQISNAAAEYEKRGMEQAMLFLQGKRANKMATDAKYNDVCFFRITAVDSITGEPIETAVLDIYRSGSNSGSFLKAVTDDKGTQSFLLEKGSYRLIITLPEAYPDPAFHAPAVYDFELAQPGRTELNIVLERQFGSALKIKSAHIQYIP